MFYNNFNYGAYPYMNDDWDMQYDTSPFYQTMPYQVIPQQFFPRPPQGTRPPMFRPPLTTRPPAFRPPLTSRPPVMGAPEFRPPLGGGCGRPPQIQPFMPQTNLNSQATEQFPQIMPIQYQ
ncbi:MAG: hypothetical protein GX661_02260 [Acholeplasmataceae bacterium]|nr:hypothetical protein [Acholeplasmataceae bacterium]